MRSDRLKRERCNVVQSTHTYVVWQETFRELQQQMWKTGKNKRKNKKNAVFEEGGVEPGEYETEGGLLPSLSVTGLGTGKPKRGRR